MRPLYLFLSLFAMPLSLSAVAAQFPLDASALYERVAPSVCLIATFDDEGMALGSGSGVLISNDGQLATNKHVIEGASRVAVNCNGQRSEALHISGLHPSLDLAVIKTNFSGNNFLQVDKKYRVSKGQAVFVIGNPLGLSGTITSGLSSGYRDFSGKKALQISAPINPGNSGGAVVDQYGKLAGIATFKFSDTEGLSFAVPASELLSVQDLVIAFSDLRQPREKKEQRTEIYSEFQFRGIPFGTDCERARGILGASEFFEGQYLRQMDLMGKPVVAYMKCYDHVLQEAGYYFRQSLREPLEIALRKKYGPEDEFDMLFPYGLTTKWTISEGQIIGIRATLLGLPKEYNYFHFRLAYMDNKLKSYLDELKALSALSNNEL